LGKNEKKKKKNHQRQVKKKKETKISRFYKEGIKSAIRTKGAKPNPKGTSNALKGSYSI